MNEEPKDIKSIFAEAIEKKSEKERAAFLDKACKGDSDLRSKVEDLLKAHNEAGDFLEEPAIGASVTLGDSHPTEGPGTRIGRYKLLQLIGEGGFGAVYMTEQEKPIHRRVALKIIKLGMDTKQVIARFEAERQALAMMNHPNIARVFDAGATDTGRPYFVMELVKGIPITEYCDKNNLDTRQRLDLFMEVCKAVQHAHQKGIIHRDIKPSNVMITLHDGKPVPKIIDFGIAKATQHRLTEKTFFTEYQQFIGTPEYMSPEQAEMSGLDVDTRSDIYSLGVLLYELLTGTTPFEADKLRSAAYDEIRRIIREDEPPKPSTRLSSLGDALSDVAKHRHVQPAQLCKTVRGDLDWVVMKALEKDRTLRYETANEFARDIERHLGDEPVSAGPPSTVYRLRKFVRRNRALVTGVAAVLVVLAGGILVSTIFAVGQARARAEAEALRDESKQHVRLLTYESDFFGDALADTLGIAHKEGSEATVSLFLDIGSKKLSGINLNERYPLAEASIHQKLGDWYVMIGEFKKAEPHMKRALEVRRDIFGEIHEITEESMRRLAYAYERLRRYEEAERLYLKGLEGTRRTCGEESKSACWYMCLLGDLYNMQGRVGEAERMYQNALEINRRVRGEEDESTVGSMNRLALLYEFTHRLDEAATLFAKQLEIRRRTLGEEHLWTLVPMSHLASVYEKQGLYHKAEPLYAKELETRRCRQGDEHPNTLRCMRELAAMYVKQERYDKAEALLTERIQIQRRILGEEHLDTVSSINKLIELYEAWGKPQKAEEWRSKLPRNKDTEEQ